jgi:butyrate kinase
LVGFKRITDQFEFRKDIIIKELQGAEIDINKISAVVGRGGLIKPIESGVYFVNDRMKEDLMNSIRGEHASNLGALIADDIARNLPSAKAYIADPVVVDELQDIARISGHPKFERVSIFHALNQKAIARQYAKSLDKKYEELNIIVAHLGGGISVGAHYNGRVIDVNNALDGEGPFSPERAGTVPAGQLAKLCFSGEVTYDEVKKMLTGQGGMVAHAGTNDAYEIEMKAKAGDKKAQLLQDAMSYNVAKHIGQMATVLKGKVDGIILTGGIAHNPYLVEYVKEMVGFIAPVSVYPGEDEMQALALNGLMVLRGDVLPHEYK